MAANVVYGVGAPALSDFSYQGGGNPIYIDGATGDIYVLLNGVSPYNTIARVVKYNWRYIKIKNSDESRSSNTTLANDADLVFPVGSNDVWCGRVFVDCGSGVSTTGIKITISAPSGATGNIHASLTTNASGGKEVDVQQTNTLGAAIDITAASLSGTATLGHLEITFRVANGANAGNIALQWAQSTSSATALVIGAGSQMTVDRIS